jgi:hypothetical protein
MRSTEIDPRMEPRPAVLTQVQVPHKHAIRRDEWGGSVLGLGHHGRALRVLDGVEMHWPSRSPSRTCSGHGSLGQAHLATYRHSSSSPAMGAATSELNRSTVRERGAATCTRCAACCTLRRVAIRSRVRPRLFGGSGGPPHHGGRRRCGSSRRSRSDARRRRG